MDRLFRSRYVGTLLIAAASSALTYGLVTKRTPLAAGGAPASAKTAPTAKFSPSDAAPASNVARWTVQAIGADAEVARRAINELRAMGPAGLGAFAASYERELSRLQADPTCRRVAGSPERRLSDAYDAIAGQHDAVFSHLYWYTDLTAARSAAEREGKPILSLRMLGKLTDELSCANSRFFRTTLYADPQIAALLRRNFVLHWHSIRPVPKITIDFGDGRRLERTLTGNSAHYILDRRGDVVDVLPGLYSSPAFARELNRAMETIGILDRVDAPDRTGVLALYHRENLRRLNSGLIEQFSVDGGAPGVFSSDLDIPFPKTSFEQSAARSVTQNSLPDIPAQTAGVGPKHTAGRQEPYVPPAAVAQQGSYPSVALPAPSSEPPSVGTALTAAQLERLAGIAEREITLSSAVVRLIDAKLASIPAEALPASRAELRSRTLANLVRGIAYETARNEYDFHRRVHDWFEFGAPIDLDRLDDRVYAELFLMPRTDPWAGLLSIDSFSAIDACGIVVGK